MIWILWLIFIFADAWFNVWRERKYKIIRHGINVVYRSLAGVAFVWGFGLWGDWLRLTFFILAAFFSFWFLFNLTVNMLKRLPINHLGKKAILDRFEQATLPWVVWAFFKIILASSFIYYYYNTDLL